ncbi:hypothetical protein FH5_03605 [Priestia endophytica]|nr:hypothetical protein FH5_03605 [Priestia endophytica]
MDRVYSYKKKKDYLLKERREDREVVFFTSTCLYRIGVLEA